MCDSFQMQQCQFLRVPCQDVNHFKSWGFQIPAFCWRWENGWSRSAEGPEAVLSGSTVITVCLLSCRASPLLSQGWSGWEARREYSRGLQARGCWVEEGEVDCFCICSFSAYMWPNYVLVNWNHMSFWKQDFLITLSMNLVWK